MDCIVSMKKYKDMLDALHEVCEVYKQDRDNARQQAEQYKEWWLEETTKTTKLSRDLDKAVEYTNELEDENTSLNNQLMAYTDIEYLDDDDDCDDDDDLDDIDSDEPVTTRSDAIDAMLNSVASAISSAYVEDEH